MRTCNYHSGRSRNVMQHRQSVVGRRKFSCESPGVGCGQGCTVLLYSHRAAPHARSKGPSMPKRVAPHCRCSSCPAMSCIGSCCSVNSDPMFKPYVSLHPDSALHVLLCLSVYQQQESALYSQKNTLASIAI